MNQPSDNEAANADAHLGKVTFRAFVAGLFFAMVFAVAGIYFSTAHNIVLTATQIPVLPFVLLFITVLLVNPVCRLLRVVRVFTPAEILIIFIMGMVPAGLSSFGMAALTPTIAGLFNSSWNTEQSEWTRHVAPHVNDRYFLSAPGMRETAAHYAGLYEDRQRLRAAFEAAGHYRDARLQYENMKRRLERMQAEHDGSPAGNRAIESEARALELYRDGLRKARELWDEQRELQPGLPEKDEVLELFVSRLEKVEIEFQEVRERVRELEAIAFEKVEMFRRGLPREMRAYPGLFKLQEDTPGSYLARLRRVVEGLGAAADARAALEIIETDAKNKPGPELASLLESLHERMKRMADTAALRAGLAEKTDYAERLEKKIGRREAELRDLHRRRRAAHRDEFRELERKVNRVEREMLSLSSRRDNAVTVRDHLRQELQTLQLAEELTQSLFFLSVAANTGDLLPDAADKLRATLEGLPLIDGSLRRFLLGDIPWRHWFGPLLRWALVIGLTYLVLMAFNVLIFRQWAYNEKLIYPLAELPVFLAGHGEGKGGAVPGVFRSGLFWTGFFVSGSFLGYNALVATNLIPGLDAINLVNRWDPYLPDTMFSALQWGRYSRFEVFFTMIGLSFLIPKNVSFSLWFFCLFSMVQLLLLVHLGYGYGERSFPSDLWLTLNFRTAQGAGALIMFSSFTLFKCRRYIFCAFAPGVLRDLPADERRETRLSSLAFVFGSIGIVLTLWLGMGANLFYTMAVYLFIIVITIGLVRAVAEGGILGFHCYANPFHLLKTLFGLDQSWTSHALFAPLLVYYGVLFLDVKAFIAPAMANSLKIRDELKVRRGRFHFAVFAAITVSALVVVVFSVMMAYARGADMTRYPWFYTGLPYTVFDMLSAMSRTPMEASAPETLWVVAGAASMAALLYFRRVAFWLPHPIGMIMLVNPNMGAYWFSIMLGWLAKTLVTRYGNNKTYPLARCLFIGLIVGELMIVILAMFLSVSLDTSIRIDLNRG